MHTIHDYGQDLAALEVAYLVTFGMSLRERVFDLVAEYGDNVSDVYCELDQHSTDRPVPCTIPIRVLYQHYKTEPAHKVGMRQNHILRRVIKGYLDWNDRNGEYDGLTDQQLIEALAEVFAE